MLANIPGLPRSYYVAARAAAFAAIRTMFRDRNNCCASAAYFRDCIRAAVADVRECDRALARMPA